jgi:hypothetical protein
MFHFVIMGYYMGEKKYIEFILNSGCNTIKCGISQGVWILFAGTVNIFFDFGDTITQENEALQGIQLDCLVNYFLM